MKDLNVGCILGGSLSYGKFFNLRQSSDSDLWSEQSDVDLLLVADFDEFKNAPNDASWKSGFDKIASTAEHDKGLNLAIPPVEAFAILFGLFPLLDIGNEWIAKLRQEGELTHQRVILSKKFRINFDFEVAKIFEHANPRFSFPLSIHLASREAFNALTRPLTFEEWQEEDTPPVNLVDIRIDSKVKDFMLCHTLGAIAVPESAAKIIKKQENIRFGTGESKLSICELPAYFYWEGRFVAGMYQNLILPNFEIIFDNHSRDLNEGVKDLKNFLREESLRERQVFRDSKNAVSNLHPRTPIFLTSVTRSCDRVAEKSITHETGKIVHSYNDPERINFRKQFHRKYGKELNIESELIREIKNHYGDQAKTKNVLELGSGTGDFLLKLKSMGHQGHLVGVDIVPCPSAANSTPGIDCITGDIRKLNSYLKSYGERSFGIIIADYVLYHVSDVSTVLEQVVRYLTDDGIFMATTNSNQNLPFLSEVFRTALAENKVASFSDMRYSNFSAENSSGIVREYFNFVKNSLFEIDIAINDKADILEYIKSSFENYDIDDNPFIRDGIILSVDKKLTSLGRDIFLDRKITSVITGKSPIRLDLPYSF